MVNRGGRIVKKIRINFPKPLDFIVNYNVIMVSYCNAASEGGESMLKIGEFARICNVSPQTLRYYAEEGILCPDEIDSGTGYRYYAPEKIEAFRRIQIYKDAGFALEEIKELLHGDPSCRDALMAMKRNEISSNVEALQTKLSLLESLSQNREQQEAEDLLSWNVEFEDHPEALGIWELQGQISSPVDGDFPGPAAPLEEFRREDVSERVVFLPGGAPWWTFRWSRGRLYRLSEVSRTCVTNPYVLWETEEGRYMTVLYYATVDREPPIWLLYRQVLRGTLTEAESHVFVDETDLPILPDPDVVGQWEAVACIRDPSRFSRRSVPKKRIHLWLLGLDFAEDNTCSRRIAWPQRTERQIPYTRFLRPTSEGQGAILNKDRQVAEVYRLTEVDGEVFLFAQHKAEDYYYGGRKPVWYVFRRADSECPKKKRKER